MDVRPYESRDRDTCLGIFDSLAPEPFDSSARPFFEAWLDRPAGPYFVMEHEECVVGCGGYALSPDRSTARLCRGMVRHSSHKMGLGRFLLMYRIRVNGTENEAHGPGVALIELVKKLTVCP